MSRLTRLGDSELWKSQLIALMNVTSLNIYHINSDIVVKGWRCIATGIRVEKWKIIINHSQVSFWNGKKRQIYLRLIYIWELILVRNRESLWERSVSHEGSDHFWVGNKTITYRVRRTENYIHYFTDFQVIYCLLNVKQKPHCASMRYIAGVTKFPLDNNQTWFMNLTV